MILSRAKAATKEIITAKDKLQKKLQIEDFITNRDYTGAIALLEFNKSTNTQDEKFPTLPWLSYCAFHLGDFQKAISVYQEILAVPGADPSNHVFLACCYFFEGMYKESEEEALKGPSSPLQNRLLFHLAHKFADEAKLMTYHQKLQDTIEDQLSLASIHYLRNHFQEAVDVYKKLLLENRDYLACNVYVALCYYKLDYYDVSLEVLNAYLQQFPDSAIAINLKACNHYRLYNGKAAEAELKVLLDLQSTAYVFENSVAKHNLVVFRGGEGALQALPPLIDIVPEARLNLVIYYLKNEEVEEAYNLMKDVEPVTPQEYMLKGVVNAAIGQMTDSREHLKLAQQFFQIVGASESECDTIPGRQCMASCFFLLKQFDDVLIYLKSIKTYFYNDDDFNWNFAIAQASCGSYKEAEEAFLQIQNEKHRSEYCYLSWLARCYISNKKPRLAWELYLKMETSNESMSLLQLIANDCYKVGSFYYAAKAFDVLERLDPNPQYWEGKRGACVGVFQQIIQGKESSDLLRDVISMLRNTSNPQVEFIMRVMKKWAKDNNVRV